MAAAEVWSHELDYVQGLGIETLYLNPIFLSLSNHKYDTWDYHTIDPAFGTHADLRAQATELHCRHMRLVLDGVFNRRGRQSPHFQEALHDMHIPWHRFFKWRAGTQPYVWTSPTSPKSRCSLVTE